MYAYHAIHVFEKLDRFTCHLCLDELFKVKPVEDCPDCLPAYLENEDIGPDNPIILEEANNFSSESSVASLGSSNPSTEK